MTGLVCLTLADATKYQTDIDTKQGYPRDGVNIGGGIHASAAEGRTYHQAGVLPNPKDATAAYLDDTAVGDDTTGGKQAVAKPAGSVVTQLDAAWFPAALAIADVQADVEVLP